MEIEGGGESLMSVGTVGLIIPVSFYFDQSLTTPHLSNIMITTFYCICTDTRTAIYMEFSAKSSSKSWYFTATKGALQND